MKHILNSVLIVFLGFFITIESAAQVQSQRGSYMQTNQESARPTGIEIVPTLEELSI